MKDKDLETQIHRIGDYMRAYRIAVVEQVFKSRDPEARLTLDEVAHDLDLLREIQGQCFHIEYERHRMIREIEAEEGKDQ